MRMVELPHFFGLDFSAASSWIFVGFIAGALLSWLWRALRGTRADARAEAQIAQMQGFLDASRAEHQADIARLLSDARNFEAALADAERRAAQSGGEWTRLRAEVERLAQAELSSRNDLLAADKELAKLRSDLQWAQSQAGSHAQHEQTVAAELATLRTAAELKDSEIARLINQLQWQQSKTSTLQQEKTGLEHGLDALKFKDGEIARLQDELGGARAEIDRLQHEVKNLVEAQASSQSSYDQVWKDLTYMRNLAYWQASEVDRLRTLITTFEGDVAAKSQALGALQQQYAALKARGGLRKGFGGAKNHLAYFRSQGTNGTSVDVHAHAKGSGKLGFAHKSRDVSAKKRRLKAYKLGKALASCGRGTGATKPGHGVTVINLPSKAHGVPGEIADLKAKLVELKQDAERYRRLRDAVHVANRIADDQI